MKSTKDILRSFILETFPAASMGVVLEDTTSFLDGGIIESTGVLELVDFLEEQFDITVEDSELVPENLDSINNLSRYLESKGVAAAVK
jgi:acyl carrier protein